MGIKNGWLKLVLIGGLGSGAVAASCSGAQRGGPIAVPPSAPGLFVAGTFEGMMSVGRERVNAAQKSTDLYVSRVDGHGRTQWLRSFPSLVPGRAVAYAPLGGGGVAVVGVFKKLNLGGQEKGAPAKLNLAADRTGVFFTQIGDDGRVREALTVAQADSFNAPELVVSGDQLIVTVPFEGQVNVTGKDLPKGAGGTLRVVISNKWTVQEAGVVTPAGGKDQGQRATPTHGLLKDPSTQTARFVQASMMQLSCNACSPTSCLNQQCVSNAICGGGIDPWCCATGWTRRCIDEALNTCPGLFCNCPHSPTQQGYLLHPSCDPGSRRNQCVQLVSGPDPFCSNNSWDWQCTQECPDPTMCQ
jgi:hypothetical protein